MYIWYAVDDSMQKTKVHYLSDIRLLPNIVILYVYRLESFIFGEWDVALQT